MTNLTDYRRSAVTIWIAGDAPLIPAYVHASRRWNGFAIPLFRIEDIARHRDALDKLFEATHEDDLVLTWTDEGLPSIVDPHAIDDGDYVARVVIDGETFIDIGGGSFTWEEADDESLGSYADEAALDHDVASLVEDALLAPLRPSGVGDEAAKRSIARAVRPEKTRTEFAAPDFDTYASDETVRIEFHDVASFDRFIAVMPDDKALALLGELAETLVRAGRPRIASLAKAVVALVVEDGDEQNASASTTRPPIQAFASDEYDEARRSGTLPEA